MENQLVVLERLIDNLNSGVIGKQSYIKGALLHKEFKRIKSELEKSPDHDLEELIRCCDFHLTESCRLADIVIRLKVSLKMRRDLTDDEYYRLMKCEILLKEFKTLIEFYKELIKQKRGLNECPETA